MSNVQSTKRSLTASIISMVACVALLIATTFAWFTSTASTSVNKIQAGTLEVEIQKSTDGSTWTDVGNDALSFIKSTSAAQGEAVLWEPGAEYKLPMLRVANKGNLALKFKINFAMTGGDEKLADVLDVKLNGQSTGSTLADILNSKDADGVIHGTLRGITGSEEEVGSDSYEISMKMKENAGNEYQGLSIDGIAITCVATQLASEFDSSTNTYDASAEYPVVAVAKVKNVKSSTQAGAQIEGQVSTPVYTIGGEDPVEIKVADTVQTANGEEVPVASVSVPAGTQLASSDGELTLKVTNTTTPANIEVKSTKEAKTLEVKLDGLAESNDKVVKVSVYIGASLSSLQMYHTENGESKSMKRVYALSDLDAHNEYYYDDSTGFVTMALKSFSPFTYVCKDSNAAYPTNSDEFFDALKDGGTIYVNNDIDLNGVDGNQHEIELWGIGTINLILNANLTWDNAPSWNWGMIRVAQGTKLVISTANEVRCAMINAGANSIICMMGGEVIINNGDFSSCSSIVFNYNDDDYGYQTYRLTINGGTFKADSKVGIFHTKSPAKITTEQCHINGGKFYNWNPSEYVDTENYTVTQTTESSDTVYTVTAKAVD